MALAVETTLLQMPLKRVDHLYSRLRQCLMLQGGATIAAFFIIKQNKKLKGVASAAGISALLGITEPAMFGVNLKLRYPFIGAIVGSGIGSAYIAFFKVKAIALGTAGLPGFISINPVHAGWLHYFVGMTISFIVAITVTLILSKKQIKSCRIKIGMTVIKVSVIANAIG